MTPAEFAASLYAHGIAPTILDKANQTGDVHEFYRAFAGHIIGQAAGVLGTADILALLDEAKTHIADRAIIEAYQISRQNNGD